MTARLDGRGTVFGAGLVSLGLELSAGRLLAPTFGTSELVWSAIIGLILLYLAVGYAVGGRWADRSPHALTLYLLLVGAGVSIALVPLLAGPVLHWAAGGMAAWNLGLVVGPFAVVLLLFALPVTLLACVSPFVIRLSVEDVARSGAAAGRVTAWGTLGSFVGALLPNLVLIPSVGTRRTFLLLALLTLAMGLGGLWRVSRRWFWRLIWVLLLPLGLWLRPAQAVKPTAGLLYETESSYNYIQVVETSDGTRELLLNEGQGIHSVYRPDTVLTGGPWDGFLLAPYFSEMRPDASRWLIVGLAAGTVARQVTEVYGPRPIVGVEIDPAIVAVGRQYFAMTEPNLAVVVADGRTYLARSSRQFDVVVVDAYRLPYIPWHLTTVEFFQEVRAHLSDQGVVAINVGYVPGDWRLVAALAATLRQVYSSVWMMPVPGTFNVLLLASVRPTTVPEIRHRVEMVADKRVSRVSRRMLPGMRLAPYGGMVFRDDLAPVEQLTDRLALRYLLTESSR